MFKDENIFPCKPEIKIIDTRPYGSAQKIFIVFRTTNLYLENKK
jgi:hypothetical protein